MNISTQKGLCLHLIRVNIKENKQLREMLSVATFSIRLMRKNVKNANANVSSSRRVAHLVA